MLEPSNIHHYQPMWTLVGGGQKTMAQSMRDMGSLIPAGAEWLRDAAATFKPETNTVVTKGGKEVRAAEAGRRLACAAPRGPAWPVPSPPPPPPPHDHRILPPPRQQHTYDFLVVAVGMQLQMDKIKGFTEALKTDCALCRGAASPLSAAAWFLSRSLLPPSPTPSMFTSQRPRLWLRQPRRVHQLLR